MGKRNNPTPKNIWLLGLVSLLNDISSEIIAPMLPLLIKNFGGTGISIGLIGGTRDGLTHLIKFFFGILSDHHNKRKPYVFLGYAISAAFKGALILAQSWQHILLFISLERLGKGIRTSPRDVIVAQATPKSVAKSLGLIRSFDTIGATIGSVTIFLLTWLFKPDMKLLVILATCIAFTALIPLFFIEEPPRISPEKAPWQPLPLETKQFAAINSIFHLGSISYMFLVLRVHDFSNVLAPFQNALLMYITFNIVHALCATPFGIIIDSLNKRICVLAGYILHGIVMFGFLLAQNPIHFWLLFMLYGAVLALTDTSQRSLALFLAPIRRQGSAVGMIYASMGIAQILGGCLIGCIWEYLAHEYIFFVSLSTTIVSTALLLFFNPEKTPQSAIDK